jgi:hypothetical protein
MTETLRHKEAFEYYLGLGEKRSCTQVARQFTVSRTSVSKWNREFGWSERIQKREAKIAEKVEKKNDTSIAAEKAALIKAWHGARDRWIEKFDSGSIQPKEYRDLETATKNILLLIGEATERIEIVTFAEQVAEAARETIHDPKDLEAFTNRVLELASTGAGAN